jgi:hypothetical protein
MFRRLGGRRAGDAAGRTAGRRQRRPPVRKGRRRDGTTQANGLRKAVSERASRLACGAQEKVRAKMRAVDELLGTHGLHCMSAENQVCPSGRQALCGTVLVWCCEVHHPRHEWCARSCTRAERKARRPLAVGPIGCAYHSYRTGVPPSGPSSIDSPSVSADSGPFRPPSRPLRSVRRRARSRSRIARAACSRASRRGSARSSARATLASGARMPSTSSAGTPRHRTLTAISGSALRRTPRASGANRPLLLRCRALRAPAGVTGSSAAAERTVGFAAAVGLCGAARTGSRSSAWRGSRRRSSPPSRRPPPPRSVCLSAATARMDGRACTPSERCWGAEAIPWDDSRSGLRSVSEGVFGSGYSSGTCAQRIDGARWNACGCGGRRPCSPARSAALRTVHSAHFEWIAQ